MLGSTENDNDVMSLNGNYVKAPKNCFHKKNKIASLAYWMTCNTQHCSLSDLLILLTSCKETIVSFHPTRCFTFFDFYEQDKRMHYFVPCPRLWETEGLLEYIDHSAGHFDILLCLSLATNGVVCD